MHVCIVGGDILSGLSASETQQAWEEFKRTGDPKAREYLLLHYAPLVRYVANRVAVGLPANMDVDDLISYGFFGLADALERFDPDREVKFETYATRRIRGSIIDALRALDWVPRSVRQKSKEIERAIAHLEAEYGRQPEDQEIAAYLGLELHEFHERLGEVSAINLVSLDEVWSGSDGDDDGSLSLGQMVEDQSSIDPASQASRNEMKRILVEAIDRLPERERLVIALYYYEELTLKEIGQVLSVSESRVSQLHTRATLRLRAALARHRESLVS